MQSSTHLLQHYRTGNNLPFVELYGSLYLSCQLQEMKCCYSSRFSDFQIEEMNFQIDYDRFDFGVSL